MFLFSFIFFVKLSQIASFINRNDAYYILLATSGMRAGVCTCDCMYQMEKTVIVRKMNSNQPLKTSIAPMWKQ